MGARKGQVGHWGDVDENKDPKATPGKVRLVSPLLHSRINLMWSVEAGAEEGN